MDKIEKKLLEEKKLPPIVVAGNGTSLAKIDYSRLPKVYDVFRVNNFYFEDHYWLGKNVTFYMTFSYHLVVKQYYIWNILKERNEYQLNQFCSWHDEDLDGKIPDHVRKGFPTVKWTAEYPLRNSELLSLLNFYKFYHELYPTTGLNALIEAVKLGYKYIYLVGFDLFTCQQNYPFLQGREFNKIMETVNWNKSNGGLDLHHSRDFEKKIIKIVSKISDVQLFSISEHSPINDLIPLAPIQNMNPYIPEVKPTGYIKDWIKNPLDIKREEEAEQLAREEAEQLAREEAERLAREEAERCGKFGFKTKLRRTFLDKHMGAEWEHIRHNMWLRLLYHTLKPLLIGIKFVFKSSKH